MKVILVSCEQPIGRIHKWPLCNYSFVFMLIILTSLVSTNKIQKNSCFKVRLVRMINTETKNIFLDDIYEYGLLITIPSVSQAVLSSSALAYVCAKFFLH